MRIAKANQEDEECDEEELVPKKEGTSTPNIAANARNIDKASAIRSKHSVTEQRRRSKINERFQILRNLIPHSDQKRDTASFLLEVIEYVQYLQEKVHKYEGSYQGWSVEPTKLVPWRNSHWRVPGFVGQPENVMNGLGPVSSFPGKLEENTTTMTPSGPVCDAQSSASELLNQQEELSIEGGTISISSAYSQGLLSNLTQALQSAGLDLTQASISVQINLGKRADKGLTSGPSLSKNIENPAANQSMGHRRHLGGGEESDIAQKRLKTCEARTGP